MTVRRYDYDGRAFNAGVAAGRGGTSVILYVHGYNNTLQESVYRTAQIAHDSRAAEATVLFAWPSAGRAVGYVADRDAADFSRAALVRLMTDLAKNPRIGRIMVVGHSMGGRLTQEALMQLSLAGRRDVLNRLEVVLADPDIDVDLFLEQARIVGPLTPPLMVMVATDDRALRTSQVLAGGHNRVGRVDVHDPRVQQAARALGVRIVDFTAIATDAMAHNRIVQVAALYSRLPASETRPSLRKAGAFVFGAVGAGIVQIGQGISGE
ncbi:hypothetical protein PY32053_04238 (plasmid) [Paracoccus yeei]|uniref:Alpha/beta fold hydrolase n=1 Tax=Paracoccus yeei TaxID=147645 RepID=A0A386UVA5_9RHOB|nr:alpha/beta fold hydrolase [Paracoccus yeei]AYF03772.1 hypothetical protein PY32053_04238 [Paracoccus yeei]